jgi:hypothetical protein
MRNIYAELTNNISKKDMTDIFGVLRTKIVKSNK